MKIHLRSLLLPALLAAPACAGWNYSQTVAAGKAGLNRVELSTTVIDLSLPDLADLRLRTPDGADVPYFTVQKKLADYTVKTDYRSEGEKTVVLADFTNTEEAVALRLEIAAPEFIKTVTVKSGNNGTDWQTIALNKYLFRQGGRENLDLSFPPAKGRYLRVEIDNTDSAPVAITRVCALLKAGSAERLKKMDIPFTSAPSNRDTVFTLTLPAKNLYLYELDLAVEGGMYNRQVKLSAAGGKTVPGCIASAPSGVGVDACAKTFPVRRQFAENKLELAVFNGDNPPLKVKKITASYVPVYVVFDSPSPAAYKLYFGNKTARAPVYGLKEGEGLPLYKMPLVKTAVVEASDGGGAQDLLSILPSTAGPLNVSDWKNKASVEVSSAGLTELVLTPGVMAKADPQLADIRLVSGGTQIPFVFGEPRNMDIAPAISTETKDNLSVYKVDFPYANTAVHSLSFKTSEKTAFSRAVNIYSSAKDMRGGVVRSMLESRVWNYNPEEQNDSLTFNISGRASGEPFYIEIDNGSNSPVLITDVSVGYEMPTLIFRAGGGPLELLYNNPRAETPQYDMNMFRSRLINADTIPAVLAGGEDVAKTPLSGHGKLLFALLLALVAAVLVWAVVKVLPKK